MQNTETQHEKSFQWASRHLIRYDLVAVVLVLVMTVLMMSRTPLAPLLTPTAGESLLFFSLSVWVSSEEAHSLATTTIARKENLRHVQKALNHI